MKILIATLILLLSNLVLADDFNDCAVWAVKFAHEAKMPFAVIGAGTLESVSDLDGAVEAMVRGVQFTEHQFFQLPEISGVALKGETLTLIFAENKAQDLLICKLEVPLPKPLPEGLKS